jgi:hypothetical protein
VKKVRIGIALAMVLTLGIAGAATAGHTVTANSHETVVGNPSCPGDSAYKLKIEAEDLAVGSYGAINITAYNGTYVSWAIASGYLDTYDANLVIVKGGPNAEIYHYDSWDDYDNGLTAPLNPNSGKWYGISHVQFCFDPKS